MLCCWKTEVALLCVKVQRAEELKQRAALTEEAKQRLSRQAESNLARTETSLHEMIVVAEEKLTAAQKKHEAQMQNLEHQMQMVSVLRRAPDNQTQP